MRITKAKTDSSSRKLLVFLHVICHGPPDALKVTKMCSGIESVEIPCNHGWICTFGLPSWSKDVIIIIIINRISTCTSILHRGGFSGIDRRRGGGGFCRFFSIILFFNINYTQHGWHSSEWSGACSKAFYHSFIVNQKNNMCEGVSWNYLQIIFYVCLWCVKISQCTSMELLMVW